MNEALESRWSYYSFCHDPIVVKDGKVEGNPQLAIPWAPPGELVHKTDEAGEITGTLTFPLAGLALKIKGHMTSATDKFPASVELTGEVTINGLPTMYKIKGFFVPGSSHVVGTVLSMANDLAKRPVGTVGAFVLFPAKV
jgi:hypothetical protein